MGLRGFATDRLTVRPWREALADEASRTRFDSDLASILTPRVLEHLPIPLRPDKAGEAVRDWFSARAAESDILLVARAGTDRLLGLLILAADAGDPESRTLRVGYLFAEAAWGRGFATEVLRGLLAALAGDGPVKLVGGVGKRNPASARVLAKAGFRIDPGLSSPDTDVFACTIPAAKG